MTTTIRPTAARLIGLADKAYPVIVFPDGNERGGRDDDGDQRQIDAENAFFDEVRLVLDEDTFQTLDHYCLKATTEERIAEGLRLALVALAAPSGVWPRPRVFYQPADGEPVAADLETLIPTLRLCRSDERMRSAIVEDLRTEINFGRGWYDNSNDSGRWLVVRADLFGTLFNADDCDAAHARRRK
jgi:hypothetical protein